LHAGLLECVLGVLAQEMVSQGLIKKSSKIGLRHNFVNLFFIKPFKSYLVSNHLLAESCFS
ncbi:MAG: hypothetical protein ACKOXH_07630, partial [Aquirufa sp.]